MSSRLLQTSFNLVLCLCLAACLPGKEEEKKVISQAQEATKTVQADAIAADMANSAQVQLGASGNAQQADTPNLKTLKCGNGQVISFIPQSAKVVKNGAVPDQLAQTLRTNLQARFPNKPNEPPHVVAASAIDPSCNVTTNTVALNAPVLVLDQSFAATSQMPDDESDIVSVTMNPCANAQPGVTITKTKKDGTVINESHCGQTAAAQSAISLVNKVMPNWKKQLLGQNGATESFSCVAGSSGCAQINNAQFGSQVVCNADSVETPLMVNPTFDTTTQSFKPDTQPRACGKGWNGQLIARIKKKNCKLIENGVETAQPSIIFDVAYVGAKCEKQNVQIEDSCPAGTTFANTGMVVSTKEIKMTAPIALQPQPTNPYTPGSSLLAYYNTDVNGVVSTNADNTTQSLVASQQTVQTPSGPQNINFFLGRPNLTTITDPYQFDKALHQELYDRQKSTVKTEKCYPYAQTCESGKAPKMISIVVDRSGSMQSGGREITPTQTACRATMANLFRPDKRIAACQAAKAWQDIAKNETTIHQEAIDAWTNTVGEPVQFGSQLYDAIVADADIYIQQRLQQHKLVMVDALTTSSNTDVLERALTIGQDCYPAAVEENFYGHCAQIYADKAKLTTPVFAPPGASLSSCQSSCPGECITDAITRIKDVNHNGQIDSAELAKDSLGRFVNRFIPSQAMPQPSSDYLPLSIQANRMYVVDTFVRSNLLTNLPKDIQVYYSEFFNSVPDDPNSSNPATKPVELTLGDPANPGAQNIDNTYWWRKLYDAIDTKFKARGDTSNMNNYASGGTPLYSSTDPAIDKLRNKLLNAAPNDPAVLVVLSDGIANVGDKSVYFGNNFCSPETPAQKYQCHKTHKCGFLNLSTCHDYMDVDLASVKSTFGIEAPGTRQQWCNARGYNKDVVKVNGTGAPRQIDSLVGVIGRNYPNTKVFYLGIDQGSQLAQGCGVENSYYPSFTDPNKKRVLWAFAYDDSASEQIRTAFSQATGGGLPDLATGEKICKDKYNNNSIPMDYGMPAHPPLPNLNYGTQQSASCEGVQYLDVNAPPGSPVLPPNYVPNPIFPPPTMPPTPYDTGHQNCISYGYQSPGQTYNGYDSITMEPCHTP